jgi:Protein of unknown function (DUF3617)
MTYLRCFLMMLILAPTAAIAANTPLNLKLGLWEDTSQTESSGMPPIPQSVLDTFPPEQRAKMEAMMKAQAASGPRSTSKVVRSCMTKEELTRPFMPDDIKECKHRVINSSGSMMEIEAQCMQDGVVKTTLSMRFEASSPERVTGISTLKFMSTTQGDGRSRTITTRTTARWLGADCGEVKP